VTPWLFAMDWVDALFLHWPIDPAQLRARIPPDLEIDTYDGTAWVSIVAFRIAGARMRGVPTRGAWRAFPEVNVRTYVRRREHAGVWFFSLDADSRAAVSAGRAIVHLPYTRASIAASFDTERASYRLVRGDRRAPDARFGAEARFDAAPRLAVPGTPEHWLIERYAFFTTARGRTLRGDVEHAAWPLRDALATIEENSLLRAAGLTPSADAPLAHVSDGVATRAWPLR
jgi:uncharacterized protein YqjF (DUF2071 family)